MWYASEEDGPVWTGYKQEESGNFANKLKRNDCGKKEIPGNYSATENLRYRNDARGKNLCHTSLAKKLTQQEDPQRKFYLHLQVGTKWQNHHVTATRYRVVNFCSDTSCCKNAI